MQLQHLLLYLVAQAKHRMYNYNVERTSSMLVLS